MTFELAFALVLIGAYVIGVSIWFVCKAASRPTPMPTGRGYVRAPFCRDMGFDCRLCDPSIRYVCQRGE